MTLTFRLTLSLLIVTCLAGLTMADERLRIADFTSQPDAFAGRTVEVQARVVAISADGQSLELFDSPTHTRISVQLAQLPKTERMALIRSDVRDVTVRGRVSMVAGRLTIRAESIDWDNKDAATQK